MSRRHFVLMIATLSFVMFGLVLFGYPPISRYVILDLHLSHTESGSITSVFVLAFALMQVPGGYLADRFGGAKDSHDVRCGGWCVSFHFHHRE